MHLLEGPLQARWSTAAFFLRSAPESVAAMLNQVRRSSDAAPGSLVYIRMADEFLNESGEAHGAFLTPSLPTSPHALSHY